MTIAVFFFFSSRRRHTRWNCDWSSDVCSSDLPRGTKATSPIQIDRANPLIEGRDCSMWNIAVWKARTHTSVKRYDTAEYDSLVPAQQSGIAKCAFPNYAANKSLVLPTIKWPALS